MVWGKNTVRRRGLVFSILTIIACMPLTHAAGGGGPCIPPPSGMAGWWPGDGDTSDIAGDNNGSVVGTVSFATGLVGQAFSFDGASYVTFGDDPDLRFTGTQVSLDAWINPAASGDDGVIVGKTVSGSNDYLLYLSGGALVGGLKAGGDEAFHSGNFTPPPDTWTHVALTYDGSQMRIYVNGVLTGGGPETGNLAGSTAPVNIGGRGDGLEFNGLIDEVEIFDRTLSASEIQAIYEAGESGKCKEQACATPPPNMVSWYRAEGDASDSQGTNDGSLENGATTTTGNTGQVGEAFSLDGIDDFVSVPDSAAWDFGSSDFSIDTWVNFDSVSTNNAFLAHDDGGGSNNKWIFWLTGGQLSVHLNGDTLANIGAVPFSPVIGQWHHVAVTRSGNTFTFYIDGEPAGSDSSSAAFPNASAPLTLGMAENAFFIDGRLDEVEIFNRALTPTEIKEIYDAGSNGKCALADLDFGDAPEPYPTLLADDGARHAATGPLLGTERDTESDGQPTAAADGDGDDEDGIATPIILAAGKDDIITVTIGENDGPVDGFLNVWIDFGNDGSWAEAGDQVLLDEPVTSGSYTVAVPAEATKGKPLGTYYGRLRICSTAENCSSPTGAADDGEVEDYVITLSKHSPGSKSGGSSDGGGGILAVDPVLLALFGLMGLWSLRRGKNSGL